MRIIEQILKFGLIGILLFQIILFITLDHEDINSLISISYLVVLIIPFFYYSIYSKLILISISLIYLIGNPMILYKISGNSKLDYTFLIYSYFIDNEGKNTLEYFFTNNFIYKLPIFINLIIVIYSIISIFLILKKKS